MKKNITILFGALVLILTLTLSGANTTTVEGLETQLITENEGKLLSNSKAVRCIMLGQDPCVNYTLLFDGNGATSGEVPSLNGQLCTWEDFCMFLAPGTLEKTGQVFKEWNTKADGTGISHKVGESVMPILADYKVYAIWVDPEYVVTYDGNGATAGTVLVDDNIYNGTTNAVVLIPGTLEKDGAHFKEWNTKADGTGIAYQPGNEFLVNANTTLYAIWTTNAPVTVNEFRVTYNANGATSGTVLVDDTIYNGTEEAVVLIPGTLEKSGAEFKEWNTKADGTGIAYQPGNGFIVDANTTLFAIWTTNVQVVVNEFKVTYDGNGATSGTVLVDNNIYNGNEDAVVLVKGSLEKANSSFLGWNTNANGTGTMYKPGETFVVKANTTLFAIWSNNTKEVNNTNTLTTQTTTSTTSTTSTTTNTLTSSSSLPKTGNDTISNIMQLVVVTGIVLISRKAYKIN